GRDKQLGGNLIAPALDRVLRSRIGLRIRDRGFSNPDMGELMRQGEDLRGLGVGCVYEYKRRQRVDQRKAAKLLRIQATMRIASNDSTCHHEDSLRLGMLLEAPEGFGPARTSVIYFKRERPANRSCRRVD